jgi:hypothetical protein
VFCTSPFIGHITPSIGPKFMFTSGKLVLRLTFAAHKRK